MSLMLSTAAHDRAAHARARRAAYALVAAVIGLALFASSTPSPLYGTYRELWGFSPLVLTLVYATYAFGVLAALLLAGRVSDEVGRRPVLLVALGDADGHDACSSCSPTRSSGCSWRAACRGSRPASRSAPPARRCSTCIRAATRPAVGLANGVVSAGGIGLGMLASATLVEFAPAPRVLPYVRCSCSSRSPSRARWRMPEPVERAVAPAAHAAAAERPAAGPAPVPARGAGRDLLVVDRRAVPLARPAALRRRCSTAPTTSSPALGVFAARRRRVAGAARLRPHARRGSAPSTGSIALATGMLLIVGRGRAGLAGAVHRRLRSSAAPASASRSSARCARCRSRSRPTTARR